MCVIIHNFGKNLLPVIVFERQIPVWNAKLTETQIFSFYLIKELSNSIKLKELFNSIRDLSIDV